MGTPRAPAASRVFVAYALTWVAGFVDAVGYVLLYRVLAANMSGNTIALGYGLTAAHWRYAIRRGFAIPIFVAGLVASRLAVDAAAKRRARGVVARIHLWEALLLIAFAALPALVPGVRDEGTAPFYLLVAIPAFAMGLQNAAMTHFGPLTTRTTHVTGTLADFAEHLSEYLLSRRRGDRPEISRGHRREAALLAVVWLSYLLGAASGTLANHRWGSLSVLVPVAVLLFAAAEDWRSTASPDSMRSLETQ